MAQRRRKRSPRQGSKAKSGPVASARVGIAKALARGALARDRLRAQTESMRARAEAPRPYLALLRAPAEPIAAGPVKAEIRVATYNVHRWQGIDGRRASDPARAGFVISELDADVIALQEVLRPTNPGPDGDPLERLADALGLFVGFAVTRQHRRGQLGNAILSRYPVTAMSVIDISHSRIERRGAVAAQLETPGGLLAVVATHLSLVDRTRQRQVKSLLEHPQLNAGPAVLLGDMNSWRRCKASRELDDEMTRHHNLEWPASFPAAAPVLALDRVYTHAANILALSVHDTPASRRASDHLPVVAKIALKAGRASRH